jgi:hypothetical protein
MQLIAIDKKAKANAQETVGKFSSPSKMPCYSWSIPAKKCRQGSKLAKIKGSVCHGCYALKGFYNMPSTANAMLRRFNAWKNRKAFVSSFVQALQGEKNFRWFDSGDLQSLEMLEDINSIALECPSTDFWLPSKEVETVKLFLQKHPEGFAKNLTVRLSAFFIDQTAHSMLTGCGSIVVSTWEKMPSDAIACNAPGQGGKCLECRACWKRDVATIAYLKH